MPVTRWEARIGAPGVPLRPAQSGELVHGWYTVAAIRPRRGGFEEGSTIGAETRRADLDHGVLFESDATGKRKQEVLASSVHPARE
jgi:hypothetical protein